MLHQCRDIEPGDDLLEYLVISETQIATEDGKKLSDILGFKNVVFVVTKEFLVGSFPGDREKEEMVTEFI